MMDCTCGRITVGHTVTEARNWRPECPAHGVESDWFKSPEQVERRERASARLRRLQAEARQKRQEG